MPGIHQRLTLGQRAADQPQVIAADPFGLERHPKRARRVAHRRQQLRQMLADDADLGMVGPVDRSR